MFFAACQWGLIIVIARLGTAQMVGDYAYGLAVISPLFLLFNLQLRAIFTTDAKQTYDFESYLGLRIVSVLLTLLALPIAWLVMRPSLETVWIAAALAACKAVEALSDMLYGYFQKIERMDYIAVSLICKGALSVIALTACLWLTGSLLLALLVMAFCWLGVYLLYDVKMYTRYQPLAVSLRLGKLWPLFKLSLPMGMVIMLISLNDNIPRLFIKHAIDSSALGYFASLLYIRIAANMVMSSLGQAVSARLARYYAERAAKPFFTLLAGMLGIAVCLGAVMLAVIYLAGGELLSLLYSADYAAYSDILWIIMLCAAVECLTAMLGCAITAARFFKIQPVFLTLTVLVNALCCLILIPAKGLEGAAYVLLITAAFQLLMMSLMIVYLGVRWTKPISKAGGNV